MFKKTENIFFPKDLKVKVKYKYSLKVIHSSDRSLSSEPDKHVKFAGPTLD
jgi:hypothetical protein